MSLFKKIVPKREEIEYRNLAIADVVYHEDYGVLSHQPLMTKEYSNGCLLRMATSRGTEVWISKADKIWHSTHKEKRDYWREFNKSCQS